MASYKLTTPWRWETWGAKRGKNIDPYTRLSARPISGATGEYGPINPRLTDIARGMSFLINGTQVSVIETPSQDDLASADQYFLGGHVYTVNQNTADILIAAGYSEFLEPI